MHCLLFILLDPCLVAALLWPGSQWWAEILENVSQIQIQIQILQSNSNSISKYFWKMYLKYFCLKYLNVFEILRKYFSNQKVTNQWELGGKRRKVWWLIIYLSVMADYYVARNYQFWRKFCLCFFHSELCVWPSHALVN